MSLIVQKYGGSSVANPGRIQKVAERVYRYKNKGHSLVVVVSALGDTTDELLLWPKKSRKIPQDASSTC